MPGTKVKFGGKVMARYERKDAYHQRPESLKHSYLRPRGSVGFPWCSNSSGCREGQRPDSLTVGARGTLPGVRIGLRVHGSVGVRLEPGLLALLRVRLQQLPDEARFCGIIDRGIHGKGRVALSWLEGHRKTV